MQLSKASVTKSDSFKKTKGTNKEKKITKEESEKIERFQKIQKEMEKRIITGEAEHIPNCCIRYDKELNNSQFLAATTISGPLLIIAGAGSGKTRTLTYRCAYFLENDINPENILLLTFTRKAANEMVGRVQSLIGDEYNAHKIYGSTFHSFANAMLRKYSEMLGLEKKFQIMDATDSADAIEMCIKELDIRTKAKKEKRKFPSKGKIQSVISMARNWDIKPSQALYNYSEDMYYEHVSDFLAIEKKYETYKKTNSVYDFDDLMLLLRKGLKENDHFFDLVTKKFNYIMVDEFQDTNVVQNEIVNLLAKPHNNIMAVGDDSQSIYAFRGANVENIFNFIEHYPKTKIVKIEQNYRSTEKILNFANGITNNAQMGFKKNLYSQNESKDKPYLVKCINSETEANFIAANIQQMIGNGVKPKDIAILVRSSYHSNDIQVQLLQKNIDFIVMGGIRFIERKHVKDTLAFLKIMNNPFDHVSWHRVLELLPKIGKSTASKVVNKIVEQEGRIDFSAFSKMKNYENLQLLEDVIVQKEDVPIHELLTKIIDKYEFLYNYSAKEGDFKKKKAELMTLVKMAKKYTSINKYLNDLTLDPPDKKNSNGEVGEDKNANKIIISTVHSSKGLEFDHVFMPYLLDGLFPSLKAMETDSGVEEERRVFYVAATRAKKNLILSYPMEHMSQNKLLKNLSCFVREQDETYTKIKAS